MSAENKGPNIPKDVKDRLQRIADALKDIDKTGALPFASVDAADALWAARNIWRYLRQTSETLDTAFGATRSEGRPDKYTQAQKMAAAVRARALRKDGNTWADVKAAIESEQKIKPDRKSLRAWIKELEEAEATVKIAADISARLDAKADPTNNGE